MTRRNLSQSLLAALLALCWLPSAARGVERVVLRANEREQTVEGRLVTQAQDGGLLLLAPDGELWTVQPEQLVSRTSTDEPFAPYGRPALAARLLATLPGGFEAHETTHYLILHNTSRDYARWCGALFERLYLAFTNYWTRKGFELHEPEFPLVAIVFASRADYMAHAQAELGEAAAQIIGYYNLQTNRMTMYDLSGLEAYRAAAGAQGRRLSIAQILAQPQAAGTVATIVHEATHQIAFNCGLHTRLSDCPLWFSEGIAIYFETPDLGSTRGWRTIGGVNRPRLRQLQTYLSVRPPGSLKTLVADDRRFRDTGQALDAYAEAWALTYFLLQKRSEQYVAYLKALSEKPPMVWDEPDARLAQFEAVFGDWETLDREFVRYIRTVR